MIHLVWELYDGHTYREECAEILSNAYLVLFHIILVQQPICQAIKVK